MALTQAELIQAQCAVPGCDHGQHNEYFLHGRCHPHAALSVCYVLSRGVMVVRCDRCAALIAEILVAPGDGRTN